MNTQDSINQILGMAMVGGKLSGVQEARAKAKLSKTIGSIETGMAGAMSDVDKRLNAADEAADIHATEQTPGSAMNAAYAEGKYQESLEAVLPTQKTLASLRKDLMLKDPTEANVKATILADKAIERTQGAIRSAIERRNNYTKFAKETSAKKREAEAASKAKSKEIRETIVAGGKPDGK